MEKHSDNSDEGFVPLLNTSADDIDLQSQKKDDDVLFDYCPYEDANFLSKIFFNWVAPVMKVSKISINLPSNIKRSWVLYGDFEIN